MKKQDPVYLQEVVISKARTVTLASEEPIGNISSLAAIEEKNSELMECYEKLLYDHVVIHGRRYDLCHVSEKQITRTHEIQKMSIFLFCPELLEFQNQCMEATKKTISISKEMKSKINTFIDKVQIARYKDRYRTGDVIEMLGEILNQLDQDNPSDTNSVTNTRLGAVETEVNKKEIKVDGCVYLGKAAEDTRISSDIVPEILIKTNAEFGDELESASDPVIESCYYYRKFTKNYLTEGKNENRKRKTCMPSILMLLLGRVIYFYGVVSYFYPFREKTRYISCDHLFSYHFDKKISRKKMIMEVFNIISAMHGIIPALHKYRFNLDPKSGDDAIKSYQLFHNASKFTFPLVNSGYLQNKERKLTKVACKLVWVHPPFVFKYAENYCKDAHAFAHKLGIAPELLHFEVLFDTAFIIMDAIVEDDRVTRTIEGKKIKSIPNIEKKWKEFKTQFDKFSEKFAHGDVRDANIIFGKTKGDVESKFYLIDYDWSGVNTDSELCYPFSLNSEIFSKFEIDSGDSITSANDLKMLHKFEEDYF